MTWRNRRLAHASVILRLKAALSSLCFTRTENVAVMSARPPKYLSSKYRQSGPLDTIPCGDQPSVGVKGRFDKSNGALEARLPVVICRFPGIVSIAVSIQPMLVGQCHLEMSMLHESLVQVIDVVETGCKSHSYTSVMHRICGPKLQRVCAPLDCSRIVKALAFLPVISILSWITMLYQD